MEPARWPDVSFVPLSTVDPGALRWLRTSDKPMAFTLYSTDSAVAELRWAGADGSLANSEAADVAWTLKRGGFLNPHITARRRGSDVNAARLTAHLSAHRIELRNGRVYRFHRAGMLVPAWVVSTEAGDVVLHIEPVREGRKLVGGAVVGSAGSAREPDLLLLVVLSWYFIALAWFEDEALVPFEGADAPPVKSPGAGSPSP